MATYKFAFNALTGKFDLVLDDVNLLGSLDWQSSVKDRDLTSPPSAPSDGDRHLIVTADSGSEWAGHEGDITEYAEATDEWLFTTPNEGFFLEVEDENVFLYYNGSAWTYAGTMFNFDNIQDGTTYGKVKQSELETGQLKQIRAVVGEADVTGDNIKDHIDSTANPHQVTADQVALNISGIVADSVAEYIENLDLDDIVDGATYGRIKLTELTDGLVSYVDDGTSGNAHRSTAEDIADAISKEHEHANKGLLDTYTQTEVDLADAVTKKHTQNTDDILLSGDSAGNPLIEDGTLKSNLSVDGGITIDGVDISALKTDVDGFADELKNLSAGEIQELEYLLSSLEATSGGVITFSEFPITPSSAPTSNYEVANKKYVDDQLAIENLWDRTSAGVLEPHNGGDDISTTGDLSINNIDVDGSITMDDGETVDGVDVSALKSDVDLFPDELQNLVQAEIQQLENIDAVTISGAQWGYLGALNQSLATTDSPTFAGLTIGSGESGVDYTITFDGEDNDGIITWKEDEDAFDLSCGLSLNAGQIITEFSTDTTLGDNSDNAVPTEKAVKAYVDTELGAVSASDVSFDNASAESLSAINVQDALEELEDEKVGSGDDFEVGEIELEEDGGALTFANMPVTDPGLGVEESYAFKIDGTTILQIYAEGDGASGLQNEKVYIPVDLELGSGVAIDEFSSDDTLAGNSDTAVPTEKAVKTYADTKAKKYTTTFDYNDLDSGGVVTITHSLGEKYVIVAVYDESDDLIIPDEINLIDTNTLTIDLSSFGIAELETAESAIAETYTVVVIG